MKAAVGTLLFAAIFAVPAAADIRVWSERERQGDGREIRRAVRDLRNYDFDDRISSLETDEPWEVCTEPLYRGDCRIVKGVVPNLRMLGLNNRITSLRKASEEMQAELPVAPKPATAPPRTERTKAEPVPEPPARAETTTPPTSAQRKTDSVPSTSTTMAETVTTAPPRTERTKAEPVPEPSARAETTPPPTTSTTKEPVTTAPPRTHRTKAEPVPEPPARAETTTPPTTSTTKAETVTTAPPKAEPAPTTKVQPVPEPERTTPEPVPEPSSGAEEIASAKNEPVETDPTPADAWRSVKPPPAPAPEPEPASPSGEWWQGNDETAGGPPTLDLFEKPNFEGRRVRLEKEISDLTQLNQPVGSLLVRTGSWQICSKPRFRGRCRTVDATGMGVPETPLIGSLRPETD